METYTEPSRAIPVVRDVDVLVAGSGPAGIGAALAAARYGVRTLLVERCGFIGGMMTGGLCACWCGTAGGSIYRSYRKALNNEHFFDPEGAKLVAERWLTEAGCELLLHSVVADAIVKDDTVRGVVVENKSGRQALKAKVVIDCTGDGDVAARASVPFQKGRHSDGRMQPVTTYFTIGSTDPTQFGPCFDFHDEWTLRDGRVLQKVTWEAAVRGELPSTVGHLLLYPLPLPGEVLVNMTNVMDVDGTDGFDLTRAEIEARAQIEPIVAFLRKEVPGCEDAYLVRIASFVGVRETRRIEGDYTLTKHDILECTHFDDVIATGWAAVDIHAPTGHGSGTTRERPVKAYGIPYRALLPRNRKNLLVAGRCISGTHEAMASYRMQPCCLAMGEAAGTAAAIAVEQGVSPRQVDVQRLQEQLRAQAAVIDY